MFNKFVSLILWCEASKRLRSLKNNKTVAATLQSLDNIMAIGLGDEWLVTEVAKKNRVVLDALGLKAPDKRYALKERDFIPRKYQHWPRISALVEPSDLLPAHHPFRVPLIMPFTGRGPVALTDEELSRSRSADRCRGAASESHLMNRVHPGLRSAGTAERSPRR